MRKYVPARIKQLSFNQSLAALSVILVALTFYFFFPFQGGLIEADYLQEELKREQTQFETLSLEYNKLQKRNPADVGPAVSRAPELTRRYNLASMLKEVISPEKESLFEVVNLKTVPKKNVSGMQRTLFFLEVESSFTSIGQFIEKLEASAAIVELRDLSLRRVGNDLRKVRGSLELEALTEVEEL